MSEQIEWASRWFCPKCEGIYKRRTQIIDGQGYHSWRCGNNPLVKVSVTITPTNTTAATVPPSMEASA